MSIKVGFSVQSTEVIGVETCDWRWPVARIGHQGAAALYCYLIDRFNSLIFRRPAIR